MILHRNFNFVSWPTVDFEYMIKINKRSEEQLENFALPIVYLFFIIYQKSKVWTITRLKNLSGCVCCVLSFFNFGSDRQCLL